MQVQMQQIRKKGRKKAIIVQISKWAPDVLDSK